MQERIRRAFMDHRRVLLICLASVFVWGLFAHAYAFTNFQFTHDSLDGLYAGSGDSLHKVGLGRVFVPAYRMLLRGQLTLPWFVGCLALFWTALGAFLIADMFGIRHAGVLALLGGLLTVNLSFTDLTATFLHDMDADLFAMMLACLAAWVWVKRPKGWFVWGTLACALSIGLYQSFIAMTVTLVMMHLLLSLLDGENAAQALRRMALAVAMVLLGGVLYLLSVKGILAYYGIELEKRGNSISALSTLKVSDIPEFAVGTYRNCLSVLLKTHLTWIAPWMGSLLNAAVLLLTAILMIEQLCRRGLSIAQRVLSAAIALLLPMGMNICYVLASGIVHDLMQYAFVLLYLLALLLCLRSRIQWTGVAVWAAVFLLTFSGVQTANTAHLKKSVITSATYARMARVLNDMLDYGYVPGETKVYITGEVPMNALPGFSQVDAIFDMGYNNAVTSDSKSIRAYFTHVLGGPIVWCSDWEWQEIHKDLYYIDMPAFPEEGYIDEIGDVMVVKLSP